MICVTRNSTAPGTLTSDIGSRFTASLWLPMRAFAPAQGPGFCLQVDFVNQFTIETTEEMLRAAAVVSAYKRFERTDLASGRLDNGLQRKLAGLSRQQT
ncbi:hypothetical protein ACVXG7_28080 [Enterobacter hormaechei]